ncbi:MAG: 50S ribosomal protein L33 [Candidatus Dadabacteria bacterium]|nr:MAG: 50S ribosomal protein L33 [Candidatus Dadabacteria bacterium]
MAKQQMETTFLVSTAGTGYFYALRKNKKKTRGDIKKLKLKKYDPVIRKHVVFEEKKSLSSKKKKK